MVLQVLLPGDERILQVGVGVLAAEDTEAGVADAPGPFAAQFTADQVCRFPWRGSMPIEIEVKYARRVGEAGSHQLLAPVGVPEDQRRSHRVDRGHMDLARIGHRPESSDNAKH
jgi:hypothetical protein